MTETASSGTHADAGATGKAGHTTPHKFPLLIMSALGVVFGDIGTSPLYAFREALHAAGDPGELEVLGLLSLIVWALMLVVTVKYVMFVLRADNKGEGGTLSLMTLATNAFVKRPAWVIALGIIGGSLFLGDAIITPAISVLSAVEGIETVAPKMAPWVVPMTVVILLVLFTVQRYGTARVSSVFGPIMAVWFVILGLIGLVHIMDAPQVLMALNPYYGAAFLVSHGSIAVLVLGAVFLSVTGAEALYVDLGHFGRRPIIMAWLALVFPALLLNYFGQGAFVLSHGMTDNPFFEMQWDWARLPMVGMATIATVIASQAVITGAYSLVRQAMHLNLLPRLEVRHTSEEMAGQIYMPQINGLLLVAVLLLVIGFRSSSALSAAYGIAVTGEMLVTVVLLFIVMWRLWKWNVFASLAVIVPLFINDAGLVIANAAKFPQGGWVPAVVAVVLASTMTIWIVGRRRLGEKTRRDEVPLEFLVENLAKKKPTTVPGTAVFLTSDIEGAPTALLHSLKHYKVLHEHNVILTIMTSDRPHVADEDKIRIDAYNDLFYRVVVTFGYIETPNIPKALALARKLGWKFDIMSTSFFLSRRSLKSSSKAGLRLLFDRIFIRLAKNATDATEYFHIPTGRVVEIGTQVMI
jgi:KUP system potassium uptake protein